MPRRKSFDEQETLVEIGRLFWRRGYSATAIDQICAHVSLPKPSIYNAYGDKAALFRRVVDWYTEDMFAQAAAILTGTAPVSEEIAELFRHFLLQPDADTVAQGCLLATAVVELRFSEPELFVYVEAQIDRVRDSFEAYLRAAYDNGRLRPEADPRLLSEFVFTVLQGLRMRSRTGAERATLKDIVITALGPLKDAEPKHPQRH